MLHSVICYSGPAPSELSPVVHTLFQYFPLSPTLLLLRPTPRLLRITPTLPMISQTPYHTFVITTIPLSSLSHYQSAHQPWIIHPRMQDLFWELNAALIFIFYILVAIPFIFKVLELVCFPLVRIST